MFGFGCGEGTFAAALRLEADGVLAVAEVGPVEASNVLVDLFSGNAALRLDAQGSELWIPDVGGPVVAPGSMVGLRM